MRLTVDASGAGQRLDRYLARRLPGVSRAIVMKYLKEGRGRINGRRARPGSFLGEGDVIELPGWEEALARIRAGRAEGVPELPPVRPTAPGLEVLFEDEELVAVCKPPGLVMHPGKGHEEEGLDLLLRRRFGPSTRLVHRIDRDTSGVVVAARGHPESARRLARDFKEGDVEKEYFALVRGVPSPARGRIEAPLFDLRRAEEPVRVDVRGRPARTDYAVEESFGRFAWLRIRPRTGRRHQIRAHLAHVGHPLAVDPIYGRCRRLRVRDLRPDLPRSWKNPVVLARQPLHAQRIRLRHPRTGEELTITAPLPSDLERALELLRGGTTGAS